MNKSFRIVWRMADSEKPYRLTMSLSDDEAKLCNKTKLALEKRMGVPVPYTNVVRLALRALAKQEGVK